MGTIRFELRKDKIDKQGRAPIRLIYQISGQRKFYNTDQKTFPDNWDEKEQKAVYFKLDEKGKKVLGQLMELDVKKLNNKLLDFKRDIEKIEDRFQANGTIYTPEMVLKALSEKDAPVAQKDNSSKELFAFIERYLTDHEHTRVKGSLNVYKSLKTHLEDYQKVTKSKVAFDKIDYPFFQSFQNFLVSLTKQVKDKETGKLKTVKALNNITIAKQLSTLKTFLNYAKRQGIEVSNKYETFRIKRENELEVIALTRAEFETLLIQDLSRKPAWDQVRDVFIFSCVTSLRYSDLKQLRWEHIKDNFIELTAVKTSHKTKIPLTPISKAILNKYEKEPRPLPVISNQRSNEHLAKICDWAGINEPVEIVRKYGAQRVAIKYPKYELIRMHCGRKTFASLSLEAGMSAEYVMRVGSWKDYKSFKRYLNLNDDSTMTAMEQAWGAKVIKPKLKAI